MRSTRIQIGRKQLRASALATMLMLSLFCYASVFGTLKVIIHDPEHRPVKGAKVVLRDRTSSWSREAASDENGLATVLSVPVGVYDVTVTVPGFQAQTQAVTIASDSTQELHFALQIATVQQNVNVSAEPELVNPSSSTTQSLISRQEIGQTPGADRTNSMAMITSFVPGAVMVHDQLHIRGGHQVTWAIDGVPIPNTNIASNVGPQFDPKDVDYIETQRGGFSSDYGDRTYGIFDVVTRTGFERKRQAELVTSLGSFYSTDDQLSFGDHTDRFAYYASLNGNRSDHGLETPTSNVLHDLGSGGGAFTSLIFNPNPNNQVRFVGALREDFYQVPNDLDLQAAGVRDHEREQDAFGNLTFLHNIGNSMVLSVSPFFHFNRAAFEGGPSDVPSATDNRASTYAGGQVSLTLVKGRHNAKVGLYAFGQHDNTLFALVADDGSGTVLRQRQKLPGDLEALFLEDQYKPTQWLTLNLGARFTRFSGALTETAASPRVGAAVQIPRLHWVVRGAYSRFYQAPPLSTLSGPLLQFASDQGLGFVPLRGERDEQHEVGLAIPFQGWAADFAYFRTGAHNFFDHDVIGNSNIFFPLTIQSVRIRGFESTLRAPRLFNRADFHLAYSHQSVEGQGGVTGGLTDFSPPAEGFFFLDHDQRDTLTVGFRSEMAWRSWVSANFSYGSGFLNGNGPDHLPSYGTFDLAVGKEFGESWSVRVSGTNLANKHYFIDLSNTFGGSHFADPRIISMQVRYRFHY